MLDEAREKAVTPDEISSEVCFRVGTLEQQGHNNEALDLLRDRGHLYKSQSYATHVMARVLFKLGRERDALNVMNSSPYEAEMASSPMRAMDAKFFHVFLLAKSGDPSAREILEEIPEDYIQLSIYRDDLMTKSDVIALLAR